jgi:hypothetical protein
MSGTPYEAVRRALEILASGLRPIVEQELQRAHGERWSTVANARLIPGRRNAPWDAQAQLAIMIDNWPTFRDKLGHTGRALVSELREDRNRWAHQESFSRDDAHRTVDSVGRLLRLAGATNVADAESLKADLLSELAGRSANSRQDLRPRPSARIADAQPVKVRPSAVRLESPQPRARSSSGSADLRATRLVSDFATVFSVTPRPFGTNSVGYLGCSDGVEGVQWNAWVDLRSGEAVLGVNLEGITYDNWPVARFIQRELDHSELPALAASLADADRIRVRWLRHVWQGHSTVATKEAVILEPSPLSGITPVLWRQTLVEALQSLDESRSYRGRKKMMVTLARSGERVERWVSPHLTVTAPLDMGRGLEEESFVEPLRAARKMLAPVYNLVRQRSR